MRTGPTTLAAMIPVVLDELFSIPKQLSPRLAWIEHHGILTHEPPNADDQWWAIKPTEEDKGKIIGECFADNGRYYDDEYDLTGKGATENEAILDCAVKNNLRLWNEA